MLNQFIWDVLCICFPRMLYYLSCHNAFCDKQLRAWVVKKKWDKEKRGIYVCTNVKTLGSSYTTECLIFSNSSLERDKFWWNISSLLKGQYLILAQTQTNLRSDAKTIRQVLCGAPTHLLSQTEQARVWMVGGLFSRETFWILTH